MPPNNGLKLPARPAVVPLLWVLAAAPQLKPDPLAGYRNVARIHPEPSGVTFMKSVDLGKHGFGAWRAFTIKGERELLSQLPTSPGVYSMRFTRSESRLRGESDIAYIGKGTNQNGLQGRIRQYFHPGWRQSTNLAMKARLLQGVPLELACVVTQGTEEAVDLESELLLAFEAEHGERPPFNKQAALAHLWGKATESSAG